MGSKRGGWRVCVCGLGLKEEEMGMEEWTLGLREGGAWL